MHWSELKLLRVYFLAHNYILHISISSEKVSRVILGGKCVLVNRHKVCPILQEATFAVFTPYRLGPIWILIGAIGQYNGKLMVTITTHFYAHCYESNRWLCESQTTASLRPSTNIWWDFLYLQKVYSKDSL